MATATLLSLLLLLAHQAAAQTFTTSISAIEATVRDRAFGLLRRTGQLVAVPLPACAVEATAVRVRSAALWTDGVNATAAAFAVPRRVVPLPFARRVVVVFLRFPPGAPHFAAPSGYALAAPVAGLLAYDASRPRNGSSVALRALAAPVRVEFASLAPAPEGFDAAAARCVAFAADGKAAAIHPMASAAACAVLGTGYYGVAVRLETPAAAEVKVRARWWSGTVAVAASGAVGVGLLAVCAAGVVRWSRRRRREGMELRALAGEELGRMAVRGSRMPSAKVMRTRPEMLEGGPLPWRNS